MLYITWPFFCVFEWTEKGQYSCFNRHNLKRSGLSKRATVNWLLFTVSEFSNVENDLELFLWFLCLSQSVQLIKVGQWHISLICPSLSVFVPESRGPHQWGQFTARSHGSAGWLDVIALRPTHLIVRDGGRGEFSQHTTMTTLQRHLLSLSLFTHEQGYN